MNKFHVFTECETTLANFRDLQKRIEPDAEKTRSLYSIKAFIEFAKKKSCVFQNSSQFRIRCFILRGYNP
ncbi:unnamed protein product [Moneuplotes crassus]|uniref:Uncharacterized protein n=1 Tax=Euplotes crassus TaxID=5936 RepID=A0AAD1XNA5_EUPCR|nr:unnamed protein product [Moneuplotes crassus]